RLRRGAQAGDQALVMEARRLLGEIRFWHGEPYRAKRHLDEVVRPYDVERRRARALRYGEDPSAVAQGYLAIVSWLCGRADEGLLRVRALVDFARERAHAFSLSVALLLARLVHQLRREPGQAREATEALIAVATDQGFPEWLGWGEFVRGWGLAREGRAGEGIAEEERGDAPTVRTRATR